MDLRRLGYFVAVVEAEGFTAAARALHVSQPALSLAIRELESELRTPLLYRLGRRVTPTPAGAALLGPARQALRDVETGRAAVAAVSGLETGTLSLAGLPTLVAHPVAALVGRFLGGRPGLRVDLAAPEDTAELVQMVRSGQAELGVAPTDEVPDDLVAVTIGHQEMVLIAPPGATPWHSSPGRSTGHSSPGRSTGHSSPGAARVPATGLDGVAMVTTPVGTSIRRLLDGWLAEAGRSATVTVTTAQRDALVPLVLAHAGTALIPEPLAAHAAAMGASVAWPDPAISREVAVLHRRGPLAPAAEAFLALSSDAYGVMVTAASGEATRKEKLSSR